MKQIDKVAISDHKNNFRFCFKSEHYLLSVLVLALVTLYFYLVRPEIAGLWYDDGVYLLGAKALASGHGYRLLSEAGWPAIVKYPPLLSVLLAPIWWLNHNFPTNLIGCKALNIGFGLGTLGLVYLLARRAFGLRKGWALLAMLILGLHPVWLILVTEVMSEPLYLLLSLALSFLTLRIHQRGSPPTTTEQRLCILLSVLTFYTRTIGITLILGVGFWLWRKFGRHTALRYLIPCIVLCSLWFVWTASQPAGIFNVGHIYVASYNLTYFQELLLEIIKAQGLAPLFWNNLTLLPASLIGSIFPYLSGIEHLKSLLPFLILPFLVGLVITCVRLFRQMPSPAFCYVFFYLLACLCWYANDQYPRLLIPILPFLWIGLLKAWSHFAERFLGKSGLRQILSTVIALVALVSLEPWQIPGLPRGNAMANNAGPELWQDYQATFAAIAELSQPQDIFWSRYSSLYPLYTNRMVISRNLIPSAQAFSSGELNQGPKAIGQLLLPVFNHEQVRYVLLEPLITGHHVANPVDQATLNILQSAPEHFQPVYTSPHGYISIYQYLP